MLPSTLMPRALLQPSLPVRLTITTASYPPALWTFATFSVKGQAPRSTTAICLPSPGSTAGSVLQARPPNLACPVTDAPGSSFRVSLPELTTSTVSSVLFSARVAKGEKSSSAPSTNLWSRVNSAWWALPSGGTVVSSSGSVRLFSRPWLSGSGKSLSARTCGDVGTPVTSSLT